MEQIQRIQYMETLLDEITAGLDTGEYASLESKVRELADYYEGPLWRADYESDENGLLPPGLKRGVLSEDGIYNVLLDYEQLTGKI